MSTLNKEQLIEELALHNDIASKAAASRVLTLVIERIKSELIAGNDVKLAGFINMKPAVQAARPATKGKIPGTNTEIDIAAIPAKNTVRVKLTAGFKSELNV